MMELRGRSLPRWTTHSAEPAVHPIKRNGSAHVPAGTSRRAQRLNAMRNRSGPCAEGPVEERAGFEHCMHRDRQFACNRNGGALKADALPEFEAPAPQAVVGRAAGQDDRRRFVEKPSQMAIAPAGNVAIIVDLSRLVAPGRQPQPGADRAGLLEVVRILNGGREGRRGDRADPGDRHKDATGLVLARTGNKLTPEFSGTEAQAAPRFQHRQHNRSEPFLVDKKTADILLERAALARGNKQSERLHEASDLV